MRIVVHFLLTGIALLFGRRLVVTVAVVVVVVVVIVVIVVIVHHDGAQHAHETLEHDGQVASHRSALVICLATLRPEQRERAARESTAR